MLNVRLAGLALCVVSGLMAGCPQSSSPNQMPGDAASDDLAVSSDAGRIGDAAAGEELPGTDAATGDLPGEVSLPPVDEELPAEYLEQEVEWFPCPLLYQSDLADAECADVEVPLRYHEPDGETATVRVKRFGSDAPARQLYMLQGGPGASGTATLGASMAKVVETDPDLVVYAVDHRGTGHSLVLECPGQQSADSEFGGAISGDEWEACAEYVENNYPLDAISVSNSARDVGLLVELLRIPEVPVVVYGISYGTYWAHRYARIFPSQPTAVILDSLIPPEGYRNDTRDQLEDEVTEDLFSLCAEDGLCSDKMGATPWSSANDYFHAFRTGDLCPALAQMGIKPSSLQYLSNQLGLWYWLGRALIPPIYYRLARCDSADVVVLYNLAAKVLGAGNGLGTDVNYYSQVAGRHLMLSELVTFPGDSLTPEEILEYETNLLSTRYLSYSNALHAEFWPAYETDEYWGEWAPTSVPILVLQGGLDYMTPLDPVAAAMTELSGHDQHFLLFPTGRHGLMFESPVDEDYETQCGFEIVMKYIKDPSAAPDASCIEDVLALDFAGNPEYVEAIMGVPDPWENEGLGFDCDLPAGYLDNSSLSHVSFTFTGTLGNIDEGLDAALADFDVTVDGEPRELGPLAYSYLYWTMLGEQIFVQALGEREEFSETHQRYLFARLILRTEDLVDAMEQGKNLLPLAGDGEVLKTQFNLSVIEQKEVEDGGIVKWCPIAVIDPEDMDASLFLCAKDNTEFAKGETLKLAGNIGLSTALDDLELHFPKGDECVCYQGQNVISCQKFDNQ